jgi:hypothetical protein
VEKTNGLPGVAILLVASALRDLEDARLQGTLEEARPLIESAESLLLQLAHMAEEAVAEQTS